MNTPDTTVPLARTESPTHTLAKVALERFGPFGPSATPGFIGGSKNLVVAVTSTVVCEVDLASATTKVPGVPAPPQVGVVGVVVVPVTVTAVTTPEACTTGCRGKTKTAMAESTPDTRVPLTRTDSPTHTLAKLVLERFGPFGPSATPGFIGGSKNLVVAVTSTVLDVFDFGLATAKNPDVPATPQEVAFAVPLTAVTTPEACNTGPCG